MTIKKSIAVIEDNVDIRDALKDYLLTKGFLPEIFESADNFIKSIDGIDNVIDAIFLDVEIPRINGIEALKILRSFPQFKNTLIIMMTGHPEKYPESTCLNFGANYYLVKPFMFKNIFSILKNEGL